MIKIHHLYKYYDGVPVLNDVSLSFRRGRITGLLGPNGAGKTTLVSILAGIVKKDVGEVSADGLDLDTQSRAMKSRNGIVPQTLAYYPTLTARENLMYFGALYGLSGRRLRARVEYCARAGSLDDFLDKRADKYSGGMKRRLNLAIGLLNDPVILYLDEPTVGVDPQTRSYMLETIRAIKRERGTTIVYTSHYMDEIEQISDDIAIIDEGRIILSGSRKELLSGGRKLERLFLRLTTRRLRDQ